MHLSLHKQLYTFPPLEGQAFWEIFSFVYSYPDYLAACLLYRILRIAKRTSPSRGPPLTTSPLFRSNSYVPTLPRLFLFPLSSKTFHTLCPDCLNAPKQASIGFNKSDIRKFFVSTVPMSRTNRAYIHGKRNIQNSSSQISQLSPREQAPFPFDYVITVCDRMHESCPTFPGDPKQVHWSFIDPAEVEGSEQERSRAFDQVALQLMNRIRYLVILIEREQSGNP